MKNLQVIGVRGEGGLQVDAESDSGSAMSARERVYAFQACGRGIRRRCRLRASGNGMRSSENRNVASFGRTKRPGMTYGDC